MVGINKNFRRVQALRDVDFNVNRSEVVGLLGDNGAGKSTLIKILVGLFPATSGEIYIEEEKVEFRSPHDSREMGIETVYQGLALVELMSILRNFFLGRELTRKRGPFRMLDTKTMSRVCLDSLNEIGVNIKSANDSVSLLSGGERQSISIGRAVHFGVKLLVLDEPTAALSINEADKVLDYVRQARERGLSAIFITHNVHHVYPVADRFVVLREGMKIGEFQKSDVSPEDVIHVISKGKLPDRMRA
jgi:simple sugar transport system ATP-binding protein